MIENIATPTLIINKEICLNNIRRMQAKAKDANAVLRPHFKTHQLTEVGEWFRSEGINSITVSSVEMAKKFIDAGWQDVLIAFPFNIRQTDILNKIAMAANVSILLESVKTAEYLDKNVTQSHDFYLKIDAGYHRTGLLAENYKAINEVLNTTAKSSKLKFCGFLVHAGNSYHAASKTEIAIAHYTSIKKLKGLKERFADQYPDAILSIGDTPTCSIMSDFEDIDEMRPGNFVYYDMVQKELGACNYSDIAVAVAVPVVAKHRYRNELVVYGGAVHLSKDSLKDHKRNDYFGRIVRFTDNGWTEPFEDCYVASLSQEHGIIRLSAQYFDMFEVGDLIGILPVHSCLTADALENYRIINY